MRAPISARSTMATLRCAYGKQRGNTEATTTLALPDPRDPFGFVLLGLYNPRTHWPPPDFIRAPRGSKLHRVVFSPAGCPWIEWVYTWGIARPGTVISLVDLGDIMAPLTPGLAGSSGRRVISVRKSAARLGQRSWVHFRWERRDQAVLSTTLIHTLTQAGPDGISRQWAWSSSNLHKRIISFDALSYKKRLLI